MRLVAVNRLSPGMKLAQDVTTGVPGVMPLLRRGAEFEDRYAGKLQSAGINAVWIDDGLGEGIQPLTPLTPEVRREAEQTTVNAFAAAQKSIANKGPLPNKVLDDLERIAELIAADVAGCPEAALALSDLATADAYTHRHSVSVATVGVLIANRVMRRDGWVDHTGKRRFDRIDSRLALLGFGLLVHDIGKLAVPKDVLNKPGKLSPEEWELMRQHPLNGLALLPAATVSPLARLVVRHHHERWDGSGYPDGLVADKIHPFARIATIADVYDAVTSERPYAPASPPHKGVKVIVDGAGKQFDPQIVGAFRDVVVPYPPGHAVDLPDGRTGVVVDVTPGEPDRPLVRVPCLGGGGLEEIRLDLSEELARAATASVRARPASQLAAA